jgi:hypothetical protein
MRYSMQVRCIPGLSGRVLQRGHLEYHVGIAQHMIMHND